MEIIARGDTYDVTETHSERIRAVVEQTSQFVNKKGAHGRRARRAP